MSAEGSFSAGRTLNQQQQTNDQQNGGGGKGMQPTQIIDQVTSWVQNNKVLAGVIAAAIIVVLWMWMQ